MSDTPVSPADAITGLVDSLDYPLFVVTVASGDEVSGCLAGFVTQCSIDPPHFLVCVSTANHTAPVAARSEGLGLHLLGADQHDLATRFGEETGDQVDKFTGLAWSPGRTGVPLLAHCAAWIEGRVLQRTDVGDHVAYVVLPVDGGRGTAPGQFLVSQAEDMVPGHPATS